MGEVLKPQTPIYSDEIIRINSEEIRKVRILIVTSTALYIMIPKSSHEFSEKSHYLLSDIYQIEMANNNSMLIHIKFNKQ